MQTIKLVSGDWELIVDLEGGRIGSLKNKEVFLLGSFQRIDGKVGSTHICAPNFGNDGVKEYGLPFHGPFRNALWTVVEKNDELLDINCAVLGYDVHQIFSFSGEYFSQKIVITNTSEEAKPVNAAIHNYWSSDLGWQGAMLNDFDLSLKIKGDEFIGIKQINEVDIPGKPLIKWQLTGFKYARLWTGFLVDGGNKIFDNDYFCMEPIMEKDEHFFGSEESMLGSGKKIELRQMIAMASKVKPEKENTDLF